MKVWIDNPVKENDGNDGPKKERENSRGFAA
jgi:hypothetical protein